MNNVLLSKNKYTNVAFGNTDKHSEMNYRLFTNRVKLKQKRYVNALIAFINKFNAFVTEKFPDEKELWLIVNDNQTSNLNLLDAKYKIYNVVAELDNIEARLNNLEVDKGFNNNCNYLYTYIKPATTNLIVSTWTTNSVTPQYYSSNIKDQSSGLFLMDQQVKLKFIVPLDALLQFGILNIDSQMQLTLSI